MTANPSLLERLRSALSLLATAGRLAEAGRDGRRPRAEDLRSLGIDPETYLAMGHG